MKRLVIFASGSGSNAENIINFFRKSEEITVVSVLSNRKHAGVFKRCERLQIPCLYFPKDDFVKTDAVLHYVQQHADYIVLAGFLLKVPETIVSAFPDRIINIHPALLPKYGGKGMYGMHVHKAVKDHNEKKTGITIHFVNEHYDEGSIIFQAETLLDLTDSPEDIAQKVHALEYAHFPRILEKVISQK